MYNIWQDLCFLASPLLLLVLSYNTEHTKVRFYSVIFFIGTISTSMHHNNSHTKNGLFSSISSEEFRDVLVTQTRGVLLHPVTAVRDMPEREVEGGASNEQQNEALRQLTSLSG